MAGVASKPKITEKSAPNTVKEFNMEDIIAQTVAATLKAVIPEITKMNSGTSPQVFTPQTSQNIRSDVARRINAQYDDAIKSNQKFLSKLYNAPASDYVTITIPRIYKPYFGSQLVVGLNGSIITIPIDNRPHRIHKAYLPIIKTKLAYEDEKIDFMQRTDGSDVFEVGSREDLGN